MKLLGGLVLAALLFISGYFIGRGDGQRGADRWYATHNPPTVEGDVLAPDAEKGAALIMNDEIGPWFITVDRKFIHGNPITEACIVNGEVRFTVGCEHPIPVRP